jgi:hypothetical protein
MVYELAALPGQKSRYLAVFPAWRVFCVALGAMLDPAPSLSGQPIRRGAAIGVWLAAALAFWAAVATLVRALL